MADLVGSTVRRRLTHSSLYLVSAVVLFVILVPLAFAALGGFRDNGQLALDPVGFPNPWRNDNYVETLRSSSFWNAVKSSLVVAVLTTFLVLPCASLAAFALARYSFRGRELVYTVFTLGLLFPATVAILPLFITLREMHLLNNPLGVALPQAAFMLPLAVVIMRPFFKDLPDELQDAAAIDGCTPLRLYLSVMLPLSRPVLSAVAILAIVMSWNAYLVPLLVLTDRDWWTLPVAVANINTQYTSDTARILAYTSLAMVPALLFYAVAERHIVSGLTAGAVKE